MGSLSEVTFSSG